MDAETTKLLEDKDRMIQALIRENLDLKNRLALVGHMIDPMPGCDLRLECGACVDGKCCGGGK
jgi:hypothetical protein